MTYGEPSNFVSPCTYIIDPQNLSRLSCQGLCEASRQAWSMHDGAYLLLQADPQPGGKETPFFQGREGQPILKE